MASNYRIRPWWTRLAARARTDVRWLHLATVAVLVVHLAYLASHSHPAYEGGLFLDIAETIRANGYRLPTHIPGYTESGVPFAYPPLGFYLLAVALDVTAVEPTTVLLVAPGLVLLVSLVPFYYLARELLDTTEQAGLATVAFAVTPGVLRWHISAGGVVRTPALLFALAGAYTGVRLFRDGDRHWLVLSALLFGLVVLTHPHYAAFFGVTYLVLFAVLDRSRRGFARGATVAIGGALAAAPWWIQVVSVHGPDVFLAASGTHKGLAGGIDRLETVFVRPIREVDALTPFYLAVYAGTAYALLRRRYLLPTWLFAVGYLIGKRRFVFVAGSMLVAVLLLEAVVPTIRAFATTRRGRRLASVTVVALVVFSGTTVGVLFASGGLATAHDHSSSLPGTVDEDDRRAMAWLAANTDSDATVLVLGDTAEWVPYYTNRTIAVGPWGMEWVSTDRYYQEVERFRAVSRCDSPSCLTAQSRAAGVSPDYVYVPKGEYTVRGKEHWNGEWITRDIGAGDPYRPVYETDGVVVFQVVEPIAADDGERLAGGERVDRRERFDRETQLDDRATDCPGATAAGECVGRLTSG